MSRSYKKHNYGPICSSYGDKYCRSYYHRSDRHKTKRILKDVADMYHSDTEDDFTKGNAYKNEFCMLCMDCDDELLFEEGFFGEVPFLDYMDEYPCKDANICHEPCCIWTWDWELEADKLLTKGIDYSLKYSDKWAWASDGGAYYRDSLSSIRRDFNEELNDEKLWDYYKNALKVFSNKEHPNVRITFFYKELDEWSLYFDGTKVWKDNGKRKILTVPYQKHLRLNVEDDGWYKYTFYRVSFPSLPIGIRYNTGNYIYHLFRTGKIPWSFTSEEVLKKWLMKNEEKIVHSYYLSTIRK